VVRLGVALSAHVVPFQRSIICRVNGASGYCAKPTAIHDDDVTQETLRSESPVIPSGFAVAITVKLVPSYFSAIAGAALPPRVPTATQNVVLVHDTPDRYPLDPAGAASSVQADPFHDSAKGDPPDVPCTPTARQNVVLAHDTPAKLLEGLFAAVGVVSTDHAVPFHFMLSGDLAVTWPE